MPTLQIFELEDIFENQQSLILALIIKVWSVHKHPRLLCDDSPHLFHFFPQDFFRLVLKQDEIRIVCVFDVDATRLALSSWSPRSIPAGNNCGLWTGLQYLLPLSSRRVSSVWQMQQGVLTHLYAGTKGGSPSVRFLSKTNTRHKISEL